MCRPTCRRCSLSYLGFSVSPRPLGAKWAPAGALTFPIRGGGLSRPLSWGSSPWPQCSTEETGHGSNTDHTLHGSQCFAVNIWASVTNRGAKRRSANFISERFCFSFVKGSQVGDVTGRNQSTDIQSVTGDFKSVVCSESHWKVSHVVGLNPGVHRDV